MRKTFLTFGLLLSLLVAASVRDANACLSCGIKLNFQLPGSVKGNVDAEGPNLTNNKVDFSIDVPLDLTTGFNGVLACANSGKKEKLAPGIQLVLVHREVDFSNSTTIKKLDVFRGNTANVNITADLLGDQLTSLANAYCPNSNWSPAGYVPCVTTTTLTLLDTGGTTRAKKQYSCRINSCETLGFDAFTKTFEERPYACEEVIEQ